jgi:multidrug efflux pump subunit AcrA (membrane-fusion protein)
MFEVDLAAGDMARLKSGMSGTVRLMPKAAEAEEGQALPLVSIPTLALLDARADQGFVYVVDDTLVARRRAVQTLGLEDGRVLIGEGLKQGERVISEGAAYVRDGQTVKVAGQ